MIVLSLSFTGNINLNVPSFYLVSIRKGRWLAGTTAVFSPTARPPPGKAPLRFAAGRRHFLNSLYYILRLHRDLMRPPGLSYGGHFKNVQNHPLNDGNGRMSRLLTQLLLYRNGYDVGKVISIETRIAESMDDYYAALGGLCDRPQREASRASAGLRTSMRGEGADADLSAPLLCKMGLFPLHCGHTVPGAREPLASASPGGHCRPCGQAG